MWFERVFFFLTFLLLSLLSSSSSSSSSSFCGLLLCLVRVLHRCCWRFPLIRQVARLRDTLQGLRKQIDSEKGMQERILREFRASFGDNGSSSTRSSRSNSLASQASSQRPSSRGGRGDKY
jgi:hypothetical protein